MKYIFDKIDTDKNGFIDQNEFISSNLDTAFFSDPRIIRNLFNY